MSPMSPMYCPSGPGGYQYGYPQSNGSGYPGPARGSEHYQGGQYSSYPGYPVYDSQGNVVQQAGYPSSYQGYKQGGGYGDYAGAYYYNCPSAPSEGGPLQTSSSANSNTPLPPDFSYVGNNTHHGSSAPPDSSYSDFYAMG